MPSNSQIILYHYSFSPYARRVVWYLNLRKIPYTQCVQPPTLPRPSLAALGISYRRIPLLSIGRAMYLDSRLILSTLERLFPPSAQHPPLRAATPETQALCALLSAWTTDGGLFLHAAALIPPSASAMLDPRFARDREDFTGRSWDAKARERARPEALLRAAEACKLLESTLLSDGRTWIGGGEGPGLVDIEAIWPFHWLTTLPGALPPNLISATQFPLLFAYISRFDAAVKAAGATKAPKLSGPDVLALIAGTPELQAEEEGAGEWDAESGFGRGEEVRIWPVDSGVRHKDRGRLVRLDAEEVVVERQLGEGGKGNIRIHAPRHGFRVGRVEGANL